MNKFVGSLCLACCCLSACGNSQSSTGSPTGASTGVRESPSLSPEFLDGLRFSGEVEIPQDAYKRAYERALSSISVDNMEAHLKLLENEILKGARTL